MTRTTLLRDQRLRIFHGVATYKSFSQAAQHLCLTQQAVSSQVRSLEHVAGLRLFTRGHRVTELTTAGQALFAHAEKILALYAEANEPLGDLACTAQSTLRISATNSVAKYTLPRAIGEFRAHRPGIRVVLEVGNSARTVNWLMDGSVDIAITSEGAPGLESCRTALNGGSTLAHPLLLTSGNIGIAQYLGVAAIAFAASVLGGISGYGTGLLLPPVLIPLIGAEAVVPVVSLSALLTNASRVWAFRARFDKNKAALVVLFALPFCLLGAYGYTRLPGPSVSVVLCLMLILIVPLRPLLIRRRGYLGRPELSLGAAGYGLLMGGTSGSGVVLISLLLSVGLAGASVIATDAGISLVLDGVVILGGVLLVIGGLRAVF